MPVDTIRPARLCMIGAGNHATRNIYPYFYFLADQAEVVANCDLDLERARTVGGRHGVNRHYSDYHAMLKEQKPDGVMICIGDVMHAKLAVELMEAGYHVYVEKPHAPNLESSKRMLETSRKTGRICMSAYKKRYGPAYAKAKAIIDRPEFGKPTFLQVRRSKGGRTDTTGDWLWPWGCHVTDLVHFMFGPVEQVQAIKTRGDYGAICLNLNFVNGAAGQLAYVSPGPNWEYVLAVGETMEAVQVDNSINMTHYHGGSPVGAHHPSFVAGYVHSGVEMGFVGELQAFAQCIREGKQPLSNIAEATHTMALHEAFMRSLDTGKAEQVERFDAASLPVPGGL